MYTSPTSLLALGKDHILYLLEVGICAEFLYGIELNIFPYFLLQHLTCMALVIDS